MAHGTNYILFNKPHVVKIKISHKMCVLKIRSLYCCISSSRCATTPQHTFGKAYVHDLMITEYRVETEPKACTYSI
jgi:hypothetical protein